MCTRDTNELGEVVAEDNEDVTVPAVAAAIATVRGDVGDGCEGDVVSDVVALTPQGGYGHQLNEDGAGGLFCLRDSEEKLERTAKSWPVGWL